MKLLDYIGFGIKNLWRRKSRTFLTIFAVVIGAISVTIMLSLVLGAQRIATEQIESIGGLTLISVSPNSDVDNGNLISTDTGDEENMHKLNDTSLEVIRHMQHVSEATPIVGVWIKNAKLSGQEKKTWVNIVAYEPGNTVLNVKVTAGRELRAEDMDKIVIGPRLIQSFGYKDNPQDLVGKEVILYAEGDYPDWGPDPPMPAEGMEKQDRAPQYEIKAEIVGVMANAYDDSQNYITMGWGRRLMVSKRWEWDESRNQEYKEARQRIEEQLRGQMEQQKMSGQSDEELKRSWESAINSELAKQGYNSSNFLILKREDQLQRRGYGSILAKVDSTENIESVDNELKALGYGTQTAIQMLEEIKKIFRLVGTLIGAIGGISLFVAAIGIINTMIMATYERTREIGILRACGATRANIRKMFLFEASLLGFLGGVLGLAASFILAVVGNRIGNQIALSNGVPITNILSFPLWLIIGVVSITTLIGAFAGLLPAIRASRLDPVEALRYE
jgi:putative ABC transport system permease protein